MKKTNGKIVFGVIVAAAVLSLIVSGVSKKNTPKFSSSIQINGEEIDFDDEDFGGLGKLFSMASGSNPNENPKKVSGPYISVININGVISEANRTYNQKWVMKQIKKAAGDSKNQGILLKIDSPGGTVYESDETYLALLNYKEQTKRPVYAYFGSLAASGGYYIGCAADVIFANRNCLTGSIGVIAGQSVDATELMKKIGVKMTTITAGKNKNMGNYNSVLTEEQKAIMQSIADEAYEQFTEIVAESRGMKLADVQSLADGRIYTAKQAKQNGLVDEVCTISQAQKYIQEKHGLEIGFPEFKYKYEENLFDMIYGAASFVENPTASIYSILGESGARCLYLYQ
ncbi:MAG: signal peptide peptidase SppA [Treponema sp.]|nr:signal peptide peptidase SppA [Candidatus Treponema equifaecale]